MRGLDARLHGRHGVGIEGFGVAQVMELGQPLAEVAESREHHVEHVAGGVVRDLLLQPRDAHAIGKPDFAVVGSDFAGQQAQQGRLAGAVAADQGDAFAGLDGEADFLEQQGTADAVVDVDQGYQGHVPIVPVR